MKPLVSIIMGSTSDLPVMEKAFKFLDEMQVPFEVDITRETTSSEVTDQDATENRAAENGTNENGVTEAVNAEQADKGVPETVADICVHVCGAVENPGVYVISDAARVYEVIEDAGGLTEDAAADYLNQAAALADGQQIYVPTVAEVDEGKTFPKAADILTTESAGDGQENDGADALLGVSYPPMLRSFRPVEVFLQSRHSGVDP